MAISTDAPKGKSLHGLGMVWRFARRYPGHIAAAAVALVVAAAATSGVPYAFKLIIDKGFSGNGDIGRWFEYLLMLVVVMALATAIRFYFVSWMGERVVADIRLAVHRNLLRLAPGFFEERCDLYNLYPLLVHVRLFGGAYVGSVESTLKKFGF